MGNRIAKVAKHSFLILMSIILFYPIYIILIDSFKTNGEIFKNTFGIPKVVTLSNYSKAITDGGLGTAFLNSIIITVVSVIIIVILSSFASYALSRPNMKGKKFLYALFLLGMSIPTHVGLLQLYILLDKYGLINNRIGLIVAYVALGLPFSVFVMTRFFANVPKEIQESAVIDGCNNFTIYSKIIMPLSSTILATVVIINSVIIWNDMLYPMIFISSKKLKPLPIALLSFKGEFLSQYNMMFSGVVLSSIPLIVIFLTLQKQFIQGMTEGAVKG